MDKNEKTPFFTPKRKLTAAVISAAFIVIWFFLMNAFYFEIYSMFFMSELGSTIMLIMLAAVLTFPQNALSSKVLSADVSVPLLLAANIVGMVGCIFLFSIFRYDRPYFLIGGLIVHLGLTGLIFTRAETVKIKKIKQDVKKSKLFFGGMLSALLADIIYLMLFLGIIYFYTSGTYISGSSMHY